MDNIRWILEDAYLILQILFVIVQTNVYQNINSELHAPSQEKSLTC